MKEETQLMAVEWLVNEISKSGVGNHTMIVHKKEIEQAKEMEKEKIIEAHFNGCETGEMFNNENRAFITDSKQYYNETFKQQEQ
jgi:hypothetical protein